LPNSTTIRFTTRDAPLYVAALKEVAPNAQVIVQNGEGDQACQQRLVEDAVSQGAKVIVLTASDSNLAADRLDAAFSETRCRPEAALAAGRCCRSRSQLP
jgi:D-xylose transport system substrate-binding protein